MDLTMPSMPSAPLNESPSEKEGKSPNQSTQKGAGTSSLNESPSEKEGKLPAASLAALNARLPQ